MYIKTLIVGILLALTGCAPNVTGKDAQTAHSMCRMFDAELLQVHRNWDSAELTAICDGGLTINLKIK